jgi:hypothetical protein
MIPNRCNKRKMIDLLPASAYAGATKDHDGGSGGARLATSPTLAAVGVVRLLADGVHSSFQISWIFIKRKPSAQFLCKASIFSMKVHLSKLVEY